MIRIITDSAADFTPSEYDRMQVSCIPLTVMFGDAEYQENVNLTKDMFYQLLLNFDGVPKTAQASPQILLDLFGDADKCGDDAIYITLSSALSGTYQSAVMAQQMVGSSRCYVVDSRNATGGQRMVVEYAVGLRDEGKSAEQIVAALESMRGRIELYACIDTLEYLYKGGRINQLTYKIGTLANIKPIINVDTEGRVTIPAKAMGMRKGIDYQCKRLEAIEPDADFPLYVMYTNNRAVAELLAEKIRTMGVRVPDGHIIQVGAAIGSHIGPDACGLVYVGK